MIRRILIVLVVLAILAIAIGAVVLSRPWETNGAHEDHHDHDAPSSSTAMSDEGTPVRLSPAARKNLGLVSKQLKLTNYWRTIEVPGVVSDRPGISDRGVVAPVTGVITKIHAHPGDMVIPESPLFSMRLVSDSLNASQLELFKATKEIDIARQQKQRLEQVTETGALAKSRIVEFDNQIQRMEVNVQAYRQDLLARGLPPERVDAAARGEFITEIIIQAPGDRQEMMHGEQPTDANTEELPFSFEMQDLNVELGQQVEVGTVLCNLADHRSLLIEGHAFRKDLPFIQRAASERSTVGVQLEVEDSSSWPDMPEKLEIHHVANSIDERSRTFSFFLALENQWHVYKRDGQTHLLWRFRPGDRVRLSVAVDELKDVFVLPRAAVVSEGPEVYAFRQNGDLFDRRPVHVLHEDSTSVVIAADGTLKPGFYVAQNGAASLNRVLKSQMASGMASNVHVHADGTVHAAH